MYFTLHIAYILHYYIHMSYHALHTLSQKKLAHSDSEYDQVYVICNMTYYCESIRNM